MPLRVSTPRLASSLRWALCGIVLAASFVACDRGDAPPPPPPPPGYVPPSETSLPVGPGQPVVPGQPPTPGQPVPEATQSVSLSPGFTPDPHVMSGLSGGDQNATSLSAECRGYISAEPNHIFTAAGSFTSLRLLVNGGAEDTTLVVQKPDGSYVCNDDAEGHDPVIANVAFPAGIYRVWVGSYTQGVRARYNIGFTEIASVNVARIGLPAGAALPPAAQPTPPPPPSGDLSSNYGTITLAPGFMPDPSVATGTAGGPVLAEGWDSSCAGSVAQIPDHIFVATGDFSFLKIFVSAPEDTTLVLQKPDGSFSCNDDDDDLNPGIAGAFAPGSYRIWVGAYEASARPQYRLGISEVSSTNASDL